MNPIQEQDVSVSLPREIAQGALNQISDFLCWVSGFNAGCDGT